MTDAQRSWVVRDRMRGVQYRTRSAFRLRDIGHGLARNNQREYLRDVRDGWALWTSSSQTHVEQRRASVERGPRCCRCRRASDERAQ